MTVPEPGGWELQRAFDTIQQSLQRIEDRMVPRPEFEAHKRDTDRRLAALEATKSTAHDAIYQRIVSTSAELRGEIDKVELEADAREVERQRWARDANFRVWLAVGTAALALLGTIAGTVILIGLGVSV